MFETGKFHKNYFSVDMDGELVKEAVDHAAIGVWQYDLSTGEIVWSNVLRSIMGLPKDAPLHIDDLPGFIHPDDYDFVMEEVDKSIASKGQYEIEYRIIRPADKKIIWMRYTGRVLYNEDDEAVKMIGAGHDITKIKHAEIRAEEADIAKSEFLANMSHEIRTPMNGVIGMCDVLKMTDLSVEQINMLNVIQRSGNSLISIINDILDFSKIESGQMELYNEKFNLFDTAEDIVTLLSNSKNFEGIDVWLRYQPDLPQCFMGDEGRLRQIITNIMGNALKFTKKGHILLSITGKKMGPTVSLSVSIEDTGIGISKEKQSIIFEKFNQADSSTTRRFGGTGLGLTISKSFIEMMGGRLQVESQVGKGSRFFFDINLPVQDDAMSSEILEQSLQHIQNEKPNFIILGKNASSGNVLKDQLVDLGCRAVSTQSPEAVRALIKVAADKGISINGLIVNCSTSTGASLNVIKSLGNEPRFENLPVLALLSKDCVKIDEYGPFLKGGCVIMKPARYSDILNGIKRVMDNPNDEAPKIELKVVPEPSSPLPLNNLPSEDISSNILDSHSKKTSLASDGLDILIAEDNEINQIFIRNAMDHFGYSYKLVENGQMAIEAWKTCEPKVILMDINMPEMNGYKATEGIRDVEKAQGLARTPIIAVTANALVGDKQKCLDHGMDDYISKPLNLNKVELALNKWLLKANSQALSA